IVSPFADHNLEKEILIPIHIWLLFYIKNPSFLVLLLILTISLSFNHSLSYSDNYINNKKTMKVHPMPKKRNITIQFENPRQQGGLSLAIGGSHKKLRRLPHIFSRVLELPFRSDADVAIEEKHDCFRFTAETDNIGEVRAHMIEIHPGVTKIVVRPNGYLELSSLDQLELDMWRFRLPETTRPELASAVFVDGELIVTVPKGEGVEGEENEEEVWGEGANGGGFRGGMGNNNNNNNNNNRLVLVQ
ncbi:hypothetical protein CFOL_v3_25303, partial [Cephalotus follicularis]